jgi:hypothetical protein
VIQKVKSAFADLWQRFVDSFVGAAATSLLVGVGALVTGIYERIHLIDDIAARQVKIEQRLEERDRSISEVQDKLKEADAKMLGKLEGFSTEHENIRKELERLRGRYSEGKIR